MLTENQQLCIQSLLDGELQVEEEAEVFLLLAHDEEARALYRSLSGLKHLAAFQEEDTADDRFLTLIREEQRKKKPYATIVQWISASAAAILLIASLVLLSRNLQQDKIIIHQSTQISEQDEKLELLQTNFGFTVVSVIDSSGYKVFKTAKM